MKRLQLSTLRQAQRRQDKAPPSFDKLRMTRLDLEKPSPALVN